MAELFMIALGGSIGALSRYAMAGWVQNISQSGEFPYGTLSVNLLGAFVIGVLWALSERFMIPLHIREFLFAGLLGGFTTFSTFCLENLNLIRINDWKLVVVNIGISNIGGIFFAAFGFIIAGYLLNIKG
ncbi:MAG: fluoride efflux transporter CrcB [Candidatus Omnitrophota bacterium]